MTPEEFQAQLQRKKQDMIRLFRRGLPVKAGAMARKHFRDNFRRGGFVDDTLQPWKPSKRIGKAKGAAGQYKTLMSGRNVLYNSIKYRTEPCKTVIYTSAESADYAAVHNEGLKSGRGAGISAERRQDKGLLSSLLCLSTSV